MLIRMSCAAYKSENSWIYAYAYYRLLLLAKTVSLRPSRPDCGRLNQHSGKRQKISSRSTRELNHTGHVQFWV